MPDEQVVLLHGIGKTAKIMRSLAKHLRHEGYRVLNIGYPSTEYRIQQIRDYLFPRLKRLDPQKRTHFVGHSLGAIVIRYLLSTWAPLMMGRVVMLGPPNQGTPLIDTLKYVPGFQWMFGPAAIQLGTKEFSIAPHLPDLYYEVGVIAGSASEDWLFSWFIFEEVDDGKVPVSHTRLPSLQDHLVLPVTHTALPKRLEVIHQVIYFLKNGRFVKS